MVCLWDYVLFYIRFLISISNKCLKCTRKPCNTPCGRKGEFSMACTEAYKEHIMYTFNGFCKVVIRNAAITAWRGQHRRHKREISLEYPIRICGQTVILTNGELAAARQISCF